jgi:hypothetical protein
MLCACACRARVRVRVCVWVHTILTLFPCNGKEAEGEKGGFVEKLTLCEIVLSPFRENRAMEDTDARFAERGIGVDAEGLVFTRVISEPVGGFPIWVSVSPNRETSSRKMNSCVEVFIVGIALVFVGFVCWVTGKKVKGEMDWIGGSWCPFALFQRQSGISNLSISVAKSGNEFAQDVILLLKFLYFCRNERAEKKDIFLDPLIFCPLLSLFLS